MDYGTQNEFKPEHLCRADMCGGDRVEGSELCSMHKHYADEREAKRAKAENDTLRLADLDVLDAHVRTLPGGSYWYSNDDTCGVYDGYDAALAEGEESRSWHVHGAGENTARRNAADWIRDKGAPTCKPFPAAEFPG